MPYDDKHTVDDCDKCNKRIGKDKLLKLPFLYLDKNDDVHADVSSYFHNMESGYRQYFCCKSCYLKETKHSWKIHYV